MNNNILDQAFQCSKTHKALFFLMTIILHWVVGILDTLYGIHAADLSVI